MKELGSGGEVESSPCPPPAVLPAVFPREFVTGVILELMTVMRGIMPGICHQLVLTSIMSLEKSEVQYR